MVAAAHGYDDVGRLGELGGEALGAAVAEVDAELAHDGDDLGVDAPGRGGASGGGGVASVGGLFEQGLAHLGSPGVVQADEEDVSHGVQIMY